MHRHGAGLQCAAPRTEVDLSHHEWRADILRREPKRYPDPRPINRYTGLDARFLRVIGIIPPAPMASLAR